MIKKPHAIGVKPNLLIVTGVSGAGKSSALGSLEDLGFEAIDNVPISLLGRLLNTGEIPNQLAIGIDIRTRDFDSESIKDKVDGLVSKASTNVSILFLDCDDEILLRRFEETRRRHPLAIDRPVADGLKQERILLKKLRSHADIILDTSDMVLADLKGSIISHLTSAEKDRLTIFITSFGFRNGLPRDADLVFDVRFLKNPHYDLSLRSLNGTNKLISEFIRSDDGFEPFFCKLTELLEILLHRYETEVKNYLTIAFGCTGGKHRSVFLAETLSDWFKKGNQLAQIRHRDL